MTHSLKYADLLARQRDLQVLGKMSLPNLAQVRVALLAELGELAQELKPMWCWWSKPGAAKEVDRAKVLGEAADVLHFLLLLELVAHGNRGGGRVIAPWANQIEMESELHDLMTWVQGGSTFEAVRSLCSVVSLLGFTPDDLVKAYWSKTEVNLRRWREAAGEIEPLQPEELWNGMCP